jgi:hypothetical protein
MLRKHAGVDPRPAEQRIAARSALRPRFGLAYVVAVVAAIAITTRRSEARGGSR